LVALEEQRDQRGEEHERSSHLQPPVVDEVADPLALRPVADLVVVLEVTDEAAPGEAGGSAAVAAPAAPRVAAVVHEGALEGGGDIVQAGEVGVVTALLAGESDVECVMEVVAPLRVDAVPAGLASPHQARVV